MGSITSANTVFSITIASLYPTPQVLGGYSAEEIVGADPQEIAEVVMGLDGILSAGFVFVPVRQRITLQADSPSNTVFDNWVAASKTVSDVYFANGLLIYPSINKKYTLTQGILHTYPPFADAQKTLRQLRYGVTWQAVSPAPT